MARESVFANRWWVVAASVAGLLVGSGTIGFFTFGLFLKPIAAEMGWSRGALSTTAGIGGFLLALVVPVFGWMFDRWGLRLVALPSIVLFALAVASLSLVPPIFAVFVLLHIAATITSAAQTPVMYSKAISAWFDKDRGLALGIATAGVGLGAALIPQVTRILIADFGWRGAYLGLGILIFVIAFPAVALFIRLPQGATPGAAAPSFGPGTREVVRRSREFRLLAVAFLLSAVTVNGTIAHLVPLLTDRGVPVAGATAALSVAGLSIIGGRILTGFLLDRFFGPYVAAALFIVPAIGIVLLESGAGGAVPLLAAVLCGAGIGADIDLLGFFVGRYFGLRSFGGIFGILFGLFSIGTGLGPVLMGLCFDLTRSYDLALVVFAIGLLAAAALLLRLGPYAFPNAGTPDTLPANPSPEKEAIG